MNNKNIVDLRNFDGINRPVKKEGFWSRLINVIFSTMEDKDDDYREEVKMEEPIIEEEMTIAVSEEQNKKIRIFNSIFKNIKFVGDHWIWTGGKSTTKQCGKIYKYGYVNIDRKVCYVHKYLYKLFMGEINCVLKKTCNEPNCVNPSHYILPDTMKRFEKKESNKVDKCPRGHLLDDKNLIHSIDSRSGKKIVRCRECTNVYHRNFYKRNRKRILKDMRDKRYTGKTGPTKVSEDNILAEGLIKKCKEGHFIIGKNVKIVKLNGRPYERCRICQNKLRRDYYYRNKNKSYKASFVALTSPNESTQPTNFIQS